MRMKTRLLLLYVTMHSGAMEPPKAPNNDRMTAQLLAWHHTMP